MGWVYAFSEVIFSVTLGGIIAVGVNHAAPMTFIMSSYIANEVQAIAVVAPLGVIDSNRAHSDSHCTSPDQTEVRCCKHNIKSP